MGRYDKRLTVLTSGVNWEQEYGNVQSLSVAQSVPEPTTMLLGLVAGVAMAFAGQRQN